MSTVTVTPLVRIAELVERVTTWNPTQSDPDSRFRYIDLSSIDQTKTIATVQNLRCAEAPSRARQLLAQNDILVSTVRPNLNGVTRVPPELHGATASTGFCVLRACAT